MAIKENTVTNRSRSFQVPTKDLKEAIAGLLGIVITENAQNLSVQVVPGDVSSVSFTEVEITKTPEKKPPAEPPKK